MSRADPYLLDVLCWQVLERQQLHGLPKRLLLHGRMRSEKKLPAA
jgi:hypothetical protein